MAKKLSACLLVVFVLTQMCSVFAGTYTESFDSYAAGTTLSAIPGGSGDAMFSIDADPITGEGNLLKFAGTPNWSVYGGTIALPASFTGELVDVSFRFSLAGDGKTSLSGGQSSATGIAFRLRDSGKDVASVMSIMSNSSGNYYFTNGAADKYNPAVIGMQKPGLTPTMASGADYCRADNSPAANIAPFHAWARTPNQVLSQWWYVRMKLNFTTKTLNTYFSTSGPITDEMIETGTGYKTGYVEFPFQDDTAEKIDTFFIQVASTQNPRLLAVDDLSITVAGEGEEEPAVYAIDASSAAYSVSEDTVSVQADITKGEGAAEAFAVAYDAEGNLIGMSDVAAINADMTFDETITVANGTVAAVKVFAWNGLQPVCKSVVCALSE